MVCGNFILPEPASYVFFYPLFNLRKLLYIIEDEIHILSAALWTFRRVGHGVGQTFLAPEKPNK